MSEERVKIKDPKHVYSMGRTSGMMEALEVLEALPENLKNTPGMALAISTIAAQAHHHRGSAVAKNLVALAKAGVDIARHEGVFYDPNTSELVCKLYEDDLFSHGDDK